MADKIEREIVTCNRHALASFLLENEQLFIFRNSRRVRPDLWGTFRKEKQFEQQWKPHPGPISWPVSPGVLKKTDHNTLCSNTPVSRPAVTSKLRPSDRRLHHLKRKA